MAKDDKAKTTKTPGKQSARRSRRGGASEAVGNVALEKRASAAHLPKIRAPVRADTNGKFDLVRKIDQPDRPITASKSEQISWSLVSALTGVDIGSQRVPRVRIVR